MKKKISIVFTTFLCILLFSNERLIPFSLNGKIGFVDEKVYLYISVSSGGFRIGRL